MKLNKTGLIALSAAAVCLVSCGENTAEIIAPSTKIYFSWWGKDVRNDYTISAIAEFEKQNPSTDVVPEYSEWTGFQKRMDVEMAFHNEADVMQINYDWLHKYSPDGEGFYDLYELSDSIALDNFTDGQLEYGVINGKLNGIPTALNAETFYYNKTLYDQYGLSLPKTWDELFKAAEVMSADGIYPLEINLKPMWLLTVAHTEQQTGRKMLTDNGELAYEAEDIALMLEFYKSLIDNKVSKPIDEIEKNDFRNGITAGVVYWISDAEYYCTPAIENGYSVEVGEYPVMEDAKLYGWYAKPTSLYCIRKDTGDPKEAAKLVDFLLNSEEMAQAQGLEKGIPLSTSILEVLESKDMLKGIQFEANQKMTDNSSKLDCINPDLENSELIDAFKAAFDEVYYNNADITAKSQELYDRFCEILAE
ncbi:MAG: ABC transporter substrate-binding protein [Oscillospiraceae bacterium]